MATQNFAHDDGPRQRHEEGRLYPRLNNEPAYSLLQSQPLELDATEAPRISALPDPAQQLQTSRKGLSSGPTPLSNDHSAYQGTLLKPEADSVSHEMPALTEPRRTPRPCEADLLSPRTEDPRQDKNGQVTYPCTAGLSYPFPSTEANKASMVSALPTILACPEPSSASSSAPASPFDSATSTSPTSPHTPATVTPMPAAKYPILTLQTQTQQPGNEYSGRPNLPPRSPDRPRPRINTNPTALSITTHQESHPTPSSFPRTPYPAPASDTAEPTSPGLVVDKGLDCWSELWDEAFEALGRERRRELGYQVSAKCGDRAGLTSSAANSADAEASARRSDERIAALEIEEGRAIGRVTSITVVPDTGFDVQRRGEGSIDADAGRDAAAAADAAADVGVVDLVAPNSEEDASDPQRANTPHNPDPSARRGFVERWVRGLRTTAATTATAPVAGTPAVTAAAAAAAATAMAAADPRPSNNNREMPRKPPDVPHSRPGYTRPNASERNCLLNAAERAREKRNRRGRRRVYGKDTTAAV